MLNAIIRFSLQQRFLVAALSLLVLVTGGWQIYKLPIDVFPDLNRPRVTVMTEAHGMAPEEVETLITIPLETALNGATGVQAVRSASGVGLSVVNVEFDWGTDIYDDRQIVTERIGLVAEQLPEDVTPQLAPVSSIMGQIMIVGMYSVQKEKTRLFNVDGRVRKKLGLPVPSGQNGHGVPPDLRQAFSSHGVHLSNESYVKPDEGRNRWFVVDESSGRWYAAIPRDGALQVHRMTSPMELRTKADWVVRQRLLTIPGVSQVFVMGGDRKQFQVLVNPNDLLRYGVTMHEVETALRESNRNSTGGYLDEQGPYELLVRGLGRIRSVDHVKEVVVKIRDGRSVLVGHVARVVEGPQVKRGDSAAFVRDKHGGFEGGSAVVLTINKQPRADTGRVSKDIIAALAKMGESMPDDVRVAPGLYQQKEFIDRAIHNVREAILHGGFLVIVILFVFLLNFRTTFITLTAIPISIVVTALVFFAFGLSINTMTLGGLAVAMGELVDDAIVGVENVFRRLRENRAKRAPSPPLVVVFRASTEVRNPIVFATLIVVLVFIPLFALSGMEGRLFTPLGIAYIVSILSSLLVSLTITPVLAYWLLPSARFMDREKDSLVLRALKGLAGGTIRMSLKVPIPILVCATLVVGISLLALWKKESDFLPPFNEGTVQLNVLLPPGTSLKKSSDIARQVEARLKEIKDINAFVRKTGRAELDEHAVTVNATEIIATFDPHSKRSREEILVDLNEAMADVPGIVSSEDQPLSHLISHMLSGVKAQVAIKLYGKELAVLRRKANEIKQAIADVAGVRNLQVEQQQEIPQLRVESDGHQLKTCGLRRHAVNEYVETAMQGKVVSLVLREQRTFDLLVRLDEPYREDVETVKRLSIDLPEGAAPGQRPDSVRDGQGEIQEKRRGVTKLGSVARIYEAVGPNTINREQVQRRIVVQCNTSGRGLVDVVNEIKTRLRPIEQSLPDDYFVKYGGQFKSQRKASRVIGVLFVVSLLGMFLVLFTMFRSVNLSLQVMIALPAALIGAVAALYVTGQTLTVASMVGFISLCGIASRNGILLISHYIHLVQHEGETWSRPMIVRAGQERLAPVLMTALTSGIGLVPLAMAAGQPGKEILYPVATVIIGGLISSTMLEFLVRPALFWTFGLGAARRVTQRSEQKILDDVPCVE